MLCHDVPPVARVPGTGWLPRAAVTAVILPTVAEIAMPALGFAPVMPLAGAMATWAGGDAVGELPCPGWLPPLELPPGLEQAATNKATIPQNAMMPSRTRRLVGTSRLPARLRSLSSTLALLLR
jgi:hypothetical protein